MWKVIAKNIEYEQSIFDSKMEHICEYHAEHPKFDTEYNRTKTIITQTTWICIQVYEMCGKTKPKTPTDEFLTIRSNYSYDLIMGYKFVEEGDVCTERLSTCDWMDSMPTDGKEKKSLYIRISIIRETNCHCKSCNILKRYVDFIDDQR